MYKQIQNNPSYPELEKEVLKFWEESKIFEKTLENRVDSPNFTFYEGPPTVNGKPGIHHVLSRTIKDTICRYKTLSGYYVRRQAGWDTHGLPVEIQIEKNLGLKDKTEILNYGIEEFNKACKEFVYKNIEMDEGWSTLTHRMGYWVDMKSAYITCTNNYVESVWWALKQFFDKGLIYRGFKVVPQSPTIETPLSSHELSLGYKDVKDPNCYIKLKVTSSKIENIVNAKILVWTTTPWTLLGNIALACGKEIDYVLVKNIRVGKENTQEDLLILAESRLSVLDGEVEIIDKFKGEDLIGTKYEPIFDFNQINLSEFPNSYSVIEGDFVSTENGSGIVHLAPAFGEDDYRMSKVFNLPFIQHVSPNGHIKEGYGEFSGRAIKNFKYEDHSEEGVDKDVVIALKYADKIYRSTNDYLHSYPHCWRTGNPIMYYARESWFIKSPEYKNRMIELNKTINWQPKEIGEGRFGNWLEDVKEWNLSRDRYWGSPIPLWVNENDKDDIFAIGSIAELLEGIYFDEKGNEITLKDSNIEIDLHRPFVDRVIFKKNGNVYKRINEVVDVWFDSGSMPFAQLHYPFENKVAFEKSFPADFIAEGIDQTRGWFYTLHNISVALFDKPAFKNIVVNDMILDDKGEKMSKSKGNTVDPFKVMEELGADAVRWYFFVNNPPWRPTLFNQKDIAKTVIADFFRSITNTYSFFALYANIDEFDGTENFISINERPEIDKWILSRLNSLIREYKALMDDYELTKAHRVIQNFCINELSNWYIRRNRRRFWKGEKDNDKIAAYQTLREVLIKVSALSSSAAPFLSEYLYTKLRNENEPISVHLLDMPNVDENLIDLELERKMDLAQKIVFVARSLREKSKIKVRQPLQRILLPVNEPQERRDIELVSDIIKEELNVKAIEFVTDDTNTIIKKKAKADFKVIGKKFGKNTNAVAEKIKNLSNDEILKIEKGNSLKFQINDEELNLTSEDIEIVSEDIEGWLVDTFQGVTVALDTMLTQDLIDEGIAREFVNRIQNLRKEKGFEVTDRIEIYYDSDDLISLAVEKQSDLIKSETLSNMLQRNGEIEYESEINIDEATLKLKLIKK